MKPLLFLAASAAVALAAAPASTQDAAPPPAPDRGTPNLPPNMTTGSPYLPHSLIGAPVCYDLSRVAAASRAGDTLYLQTSRGAIFRMELKDSCDGVEAAEKITVRRACKGAGGTMRVDTPAGQKRCKVQHVRRMTGSEVAAMAASTSR